VFSVWLILTFLRLFIACELVRTPDPDLRQSSSVTDLFESLQETDDRHEVYLIDLYVVVELCNPNQVQLTERLETCFDKLVQHRMNDPSKAQADPKTISAEQFKRLIWYLLGLNKDLLPSSLFARYEINMSFIRRNLPKLFRRAIAENAPDLL
jgi:hypothetical protein